MVRQPAWQSLHLQSDSWCKKGDIMKLFKNRNKDKEIEAEASAKSAENVNVTEAADTVKTQTIQDEAPETIVCPK